MKRPRRLPHRSQDLAITLRTQIPSAKVDTLSHSEANTSRQGMLIQAQASTMLTRIASKQRVQPPEWAQRKEPTCGELRRNRKKVSQVPETLETHIHPLKPEKVHRSVESTKQGWIQILDQGNTALLMLENNNMRKSERQERQGIHLVPKEKLQLINQDLEVI